MRAIRLSVCVILLLFAASAEAQPRRTPSPAPAPYPTVTLTLPQPINDESFDAMRKQLAEVAQRKDRAALANLVVAQSFFWQRDNRNAAKRKSGIDNLSAVLALDGKESAGWEILAGYAEDPTASPSPMRNGAICAPAEPSYDRTAFDEMIKATKSDAADWGYPVSAGIEVRAAAQANSPVIEKLGLHFVRIVPETGAGPPSYTRIATPGGKVGYISIDSIAPTGNDQICYVKESGVWKIGGYIGGGEPQ
jgi:hypothetical protein